MAQKATAGKSSGAPGSGKMDDKPQAVLIYTTLPDEEQARRLGEALVKNRLAACVNIFPGMRAIYEWKGALCRESEVAMLVKTMSDRAGEAMAEIALLHPYDEPAILRLDVAAGAAGYLNWMLKQTRR